jgi:hypothetical protein
MTPPPTPSTFAELVAFAIGLINQVILFIFALAFLVMMWKIVDAWILHADDPGKREEGGSVAITAALVMVVMVSIWGILALLRASL